MKLVNEFLVDAPLDKTWSTLLDIRRVAQCLPGATLESDGSDGLFRGSMQVRLGPVSLAYKGTARMVEVEEEVHSATIEVQAKELKGQGTASARINNRLEAGPHGGTQVSVQTDLNITGRPAQFGRGIMEDVAGRMLSDFAERLRNEVLGSNGDPPSGDTIEDTEPPPQASSDSDRADVAGAEHPAALDLGSMLYAPIAKRAALVAGFIGLLVVFRIAVRGRSHRVSVTLNWR